MAGVFAGALANVLSTRQLRWEVFASPGDFGRHVLGAALMGFGGVGALGCTIGQGLSGLSTLALGSLITVAGIAGGCVATLRWLYARAG